MNNFISSFQFDTKTFISAAIASVVGICLILLAGDINTSLSFLLGVLFMMVINAYHPNTAKKTTRNISKQQPKQANSGQTTEAQDTPKEDTQTIFVGNLAFRANKYDLGKLFEDYGTVYSVRLMTDRATRKPRGFGFVEMAAKDAPKAIKELDGHEFHGRELRVNEANERRPRDEEVETA